MSLPFQRLRGLSAIFLCSAAFLSLVSPLSAKKSNHDKVVSQAAQASRSIDTAVKKGTLTPVFLAETGEEGSASWKRYADVEEAKKENPKGLWRTVTAYFSGTDLVLADCETKGASKEWVHRIRYYFRNDGSLQKAHSDLRRFGAYERSKGDERQFLVLVSRDRFYDPAGKCVKKGAARCINMSTKREAKDVVFTDAPWPSYAKTADLPFFDKAKAALPAAK